MNDVCGHAVLLNKSFVFKRQKIYLFSATLPHNNNVLQTTWLSSNSLTEIKAVGQ